MAHLRKDRLIGSIAAHFFLILGAAFILLPFVWMLLTSIRPASEVFTAGFNPIPSRFAAGTNYSEALTKKLHAFITARTPSSAAARAKPWM